MENKKLMMSLIETAKKLYNESLIGKENNFISARSEKGFLITKQGADFGALTEDDIEEICTASDNSENAIHLSVYQKREDINVIIRSHSLNASVVSKSGATIPAVLDDVAQIVGSSIKCAQANAQSVLKALKGRGGCTVKNDGAITTGRTLDEAYTCLLVLEKGAKCFIQSSVIGKAKPINVVEAKLMRFIYQKKYSKVDQTQKMNDIKN